MSALEAVGPRVSQRLLGALRNDGRPVAAPEHFRLYGRLPVDLRTHELLERIADSGLTGRGGAGFPTATKLESVRGARTPPVIVANGAEGEPPSGKDKVLLAYAPHLVIDGAVLAARAVGAKRVVMASTQATRAAVVEALRERRDDAGIDVRTAVVPDRFVSGEETALVQFLNGGPALPTFTPPRPYERGIGGAPTAVLNVETLAHLALIARFGAAWFRGVGTPAEPGSALVTVSGAVRVPGVYEIALGSPLSALMTQAGADATAQAYLVGGYFGTWITAADGARAPLSNAGLMRFGASLGARAIVVLPTDACGLEETARITAYLSEQSAGQCGPCVHGLAAIVDSLEQLLHPKKRTADLALLQRRLTQIAGRGACRHPDGAASLVASALRVFAGDVDRHVHGMRCGAIRRQMPSSS